MQTGIVYVATGQKWLDEALVSAASAKRHMPDLPITIFTDIAIKTDTVDAISLIENPAHGLRDKVQYMKLSPYERSLFLDTDTYICADIRDLFDLLDRFDLAAVHEGGHQGYPVETIPNAFPEYNSGVLLYRKSEAVHQLFDAWMQQYDSERWTVRGRHLDQPALRRCLYESNLAIGTMSSQYNCRFEDGGFITGEVKILHRRSVHRMEDVERVLNSYLGQRVYIGNSVYKKQMTGRFLRQMQSRFVGKFSRPSYELAWKRLKTYFKKGAWVGLLKLLREKMFGNKESG